MPRIAVGQKTARCADILSTLCLEKKGTFDLLIFRRSMCAITGVYQKIIHWEFSSVSESTLTSTFKETEIEEDEPSRPEQVGVQTGLGVGDSHVGLATGLDVGDLKLGIGVGSSFVGLDVGKRVGSATIVGGLDSIGVGSSVFGLDVG